MNEEFIPAPTHVVPAKYQVAIQRIERAIHSAAIDMHMDFGGKVEDHENNLKYQLILHLFAGDKTNNVPRG